jgi:hypothetical protein
MIPYAGTFVRPGVIAWDGVLGSGTVPAPRLAYTSCEVVEEAIASVRGERPEDAADATGDVLPSDAPAGDDSRLAQLAGELARARMWLPLPDGPKPVTDGSALVVPVIRCAGTDFVPAFTSVQRLGTWADPRSMRREQGGPDAPLRSGDPAWVRDVISRAAMIRHVVVPFAGLARLLPAGLGIAINPGGSLSLRLCPDAVGVLT